MRHGLGLVDDSSGLNPACAMNDEQSDLAGKSRAEQFHFKERMDWTRSVSCGQVLLQKRPELEEVPRLRHVQPCRPGLSQGRRYALRPLAKLSRAGTCPYVSANQRCITAEESVEVRLTRFDVIDVRDRLVDPLRDPFRHQKSARRVEDLQHRGNPHAPVDDETSIGESTVADQAVPVPIGREQRADPPLGISDHNGGVRETIRMVVHVAATEEEGAVRTGRYEAVPQSLIGPTIELSLHLAISSACCGPFVAVSCTANADL